MYETYYSQNQKDRVILFNIRRNLLKTMFLETMVHCTLKTFLSLLKKGCLYSFLIVAFFENIGTPSSFEDDETSTIFKQETFLNCLVCLSLRVYWSQILWSVLLLSSLLFLAKQNKHMTCCLIWNQKHCQRFFHSGKSQSLVHLTLWWWQQ